jgi:hypothetical protein
LELSGLQRIGAFAAVVLALTVLGVYLFFPSSVGARTTASGRPAASGTAGPARSRSGTTPAPSASPASPPAAVPGGTPAPRAGQSAPDIYRWLPFTPAALAAASQDAIRFGADYGTYSYTESTARYVAPMRGLITPALGALLARAYATPGLVAQRDAQRQVSSGMAVITSLRGFGPQSIVFVVAVTQRITSTSGRSQVTSDYAVTLTGADASWQVSDMQLASAGNA